MAGPSLALFVPQVEEHEDSDTRVRKVVGQEDDEQKTSASLALKDNRERSSSDDDRQSQE